MPKGDEQRLTWLTFRGTRPQRLEAELAAIVGVEEASDLAPILGVEETSRAECVKLLWAYFKAIELQDPTNKQCYYGRAPIGGVEEASRAECVKFKYLKLAWAYSMATELQDTANEQYFTHRGMEAPTILSYYLSEYLASD